MSLEGRHILLGITGSIAAYKAAILCRLLKGAGAEVKVVMTPLAKQFITPLTMATLSKHPILVEFFNPENGEWNSHVSLGEWADCLLIAPATANTLGKMAHGIADNLLLTTYLSARCPVAVAPAMDLDMFAHSATQENLRILRSRGVRIVEPAEGELASGLSGKGRMAEPADIVAFVEDLLSEKKKSLRGKRLIVTAGATIEAIDPVRFISNHSTGKMGYAIAEALARRDFSALGAALPEARRSLGYAATGGNALRQEEEALLSSGAEETLVRAPRAGYFSAHGADGAMTVVSGSGWTFSAPLNEKTAARLPDGGSAVLLLPDETRVTAAVRITDAGEAVFSCGTHLESVLSLNECTLAVLLAEWEGYSVPESAILPGEDGETVCRVSGPVREYVPVTVLARRGGTALIASPMLRGGMSVLLFPAADSAPS